MTSRGLELEAVANITRDFKVVASYTNYDLFISKDLDPTLIGKVPTTSRGRLLRYGRTTRSGKARWTALVSAAACAMSAHLLRIITNLYSSAGRGTGRSCRSLRMGE